MRPDTADVDGANLLDSTIVFASSDIGGAGAAGNTADVLLSVLRGFDATAASVGGSDGAGSSTPMQEILA